MLCRTANDLYWMGRHIERVDNTARLIDYTQRVALLPERLERDRAGAAAWARALGALGLDVDYARRHGVVDAQRVVFFLTFDADNPSSIIACLRAARESGRSQRGSITEEMYEDINTAWIGIRDRGADAVANEGLTELTDWVKRRGGDGAGDIDHQRDAATEVEAALAGVGGDRRAIDELDREPAAAVAGDAAVDELGDVRVLELGQGLALAIELAARIGGGEATAQDLQGDGLAHAVEVAIGAVDGGGAALAKCAVDDERADHRSRCQRWVGVPDGDGQGQGVGRGLGGGGIIGGEQALDLGAQGGVGAVGGQPAGPFRHGQGAGRIEQLAQA